MSYESSSQIDESTNLHSSANKLADMNVLFEQTRDIQFGIRKQEELLEKSASNLACLLNNLDKLKRSSLETNIDLTLKSLSDALSLLENKRGLNYDNSEAEQQTFSANDNVANMTLNMATENRERKAPLDDHDLGLSFQSMNNLDEKVDMLDVIQKANNLALCIPPRSMDYEVSSFLELIEHVVKTFS